MKQIFFSDNFFMDEINSRDFWNRVTTLCKERNITEGTLCKKTGIQLQSMRTAIYKGYKPNLENALKIASVLHTSVEYLATGTQTENVVASNIINSIRDKLDDIENAYISE